MVTALITVAALAWICQMAFGGWQIHHFNRAFDCWRLAARRSTSLTARLTRCVRKVASGSGVPADASNRESSSPLRWMKTITSAIPSSCAA